jgi:hypothetical protein
VVQPVLQLINNIMVLRSQGAARSGAGMAAASPASFDPYRDQEALRQHSRMMNSQAAASPPGTAPPSGRFNAYQDASRQQHSQTAATQTATPTGGTTAGPDQAAPGTPTSDTAPANELLSLLQSYGGLVLQALNSGMPGFEFADNIARLFGTATHAQIANHGAEVLTQSMSMIPELAVFGPNRLRRFSDEFVNFEQYLEQQDDEMDGDGDGVRSEAKARA